jgi:SAM-dependent methyltransferase
VNPSDQDWETLGSSEPYFAVLTDPRFLTENLTAEGLAEFYASGETDVERFLAIIGELHGGPPILRRTLEFGCGVGRLCLPFARRGLEVVGVDVSASMLELARSAAATEGLSKATFLSVNSLPVLETATFDLVYSYIVFQHIRPREGERYLRRLLRLVAPGGTALLHFTLHRPGSRLRTLLRNLRSRSRTLHRVAGMLRGERDLPYMQMNEYSLPRLLNVFRENAFDPPRVVPVIQGEMSGAFLLARRIPAA